MEVLERVAQRIACFAALILLGVVALVLGNTLKKTWRQLKKRSGA